MRNCTIFKPISMLTTLCAAIILTLASCTGPEGPAGKDATTTGNCTLCHHDSTDVLARIRQWQMSTHATGNAFLEANRTTCAGCHTTEGYLETNITGADTARTAFANPTTINCRACHNIHKNFDLTDWNLTYTAPVPLRIENRATTVDFEKGNLCAKCHQARVLSPAIVETNDSMTISNFRWGPHYSSQSNTVWGTSAFPITGAFQSSSAHKNVANACLVCHMATPVGVGVGGHTFNTARFDEENGTLVIQRNGCLMSGCHSQIGSPTNPWDPDGGRKVTQMTTDLLALRARLAGLGWLDTTQAHGNLQHDYVNASAQRPLRLSLVHAKALANYLIVAKDNSRGIHNPRFVTDVIQQSMNALPQ